jgi:hypothetical protein
LQLIAFRETNNWESAPSSTTIRSALAIVERRCATNKHVVCRERRILSIASFTRRSADASRELVASSSAKIAGFLSKARAMARRWRWPPLRLNLPTARHVNIYTSRRNPARTKLTYFVCQNRLANPIRIRSLLHEQQPRSAPSERSRHHMRYSTL